MSWNYPPTSTATAPATNTSCSQQVPAHCQHCLRNQNLRVWLVNLHWKCGIWFPPNVAIDLFSPSPCSNKSDPCVVAFLASPRSPRQSKLLTSSWNPIANTSPVASCTMSGAKTSLASRDPGIPGMIQIYKSTIFQPTKDCRNSGPPPKSRIGDRQLETSLANDFWANLSIFLYLRFPCWCKVPRIYSKKHVFIFDLGSLLEIVVLTRLATKSSSQIGEIPDLVQLRVIWIQGGPLPVINAIWPYNSYKLAL